jgi:hypothetical protein
MMMTPRNFLLLSALAIAGPLHAASLTELETRWITAGAPVIAHARELRLPLDIIVQPQAGPNDVPLAMGFAEGRCKLVLTMRGNPQAEAVLDGVPDSERAVLIEAMTAHELAHCWRYAQGVWHALPAGFEEVGDEQASSKELLAQARALRETRREEGFADLVALAWTQARHPGHYAKVHAWLDGVRNQQPVARHAHDTRTWVKLAHDPLVFERNRPVFDQVRIVWQKGLLSDG